MKKLYTFTIFAENKPGVLYRIADIFLRRKVNIEGIHSYKDKQKELTKIVIFIEETEEATYKTLKQIEKVIEVVSAVAKASLQKDVEKIMKGIQNL